MILILTNIIQDMILNNVQEVLIIDRTLDVLCHGGTVTFKPYINSKRTL